MTVPPQDQFIIGTRGSLLAVRQTGLILSLLRTRFPTVELVVKTIETKGDRVRDQPISAIGDKGVFVRAIEQALLDRRIDLAVHSLKDVPADAETPGLELSAFAERADARDTLVCRNHCSLRDLPSGSVVGTGSLRRLVQLRSLRPDLRVEGIRGNVDTRLRRLDEGRYDAIILAAAGLIRLGMEDRIGELLPVSDFVPDAGQGILAIQTRSGDPAAELAAAIDHPTERVVATAERAVVRGLGAGCRSPVGAFASAVDGRLEILAMAATEDGSSLYRRRAAGSFADAVKLGEDLGRALLRLLESNAPPDDGLAEAGPYTEA